MASEIGESMEELPSLDTGPPQIPSDGPTVPVHSFYLDWDRMQNLLSLYINVSVFLGIIYSAEYRQALSRYFKAVDFFFTCSLISKTKA